jgi:hypothetical protein
MRVSDLRPGRALSLRTAFITAPGTPRPLALARRLRASLGRQTLRSAALGCALVALAMAPALLRAQTAQTPAQPAPQAKPAPEVKLPSARSIIDRHIAAVGGRKAILAHSSSHAKGTMTVAGSGMSGSLNIYGAKPNKSVVKITIGGIGEVEEGFDGKTGWSISPMSGPRLTEGKELEEKQFDADFYSDLHEEGRYTSMTTVDTVTFDGRPCYKLSLIRKNGAEDFDFYDVATGLKAGAIGTRESQMGPMNVTQVHLDYKKFGGLMVPTTMKQSAMGVQQILTLTSIEFDTVDPSVFEPPAPIKALLK